MSKEKEQNFIEQYNPIDSIESSHNELTRSANYSNEKLYPMDRLRTVAEYWQDEAVNPIRSERSQLVCQQISDLATFELAYRLDRVQVLVDFYAQQKELV